MDAGWRTHCLPIIQVIHRSVWQHLSWRRADGTGDAQVLVRGNAALMPGSWHPIKKVLAYVATMPGTSVDVMILPVEGDEAGGWKPGQPTALLNGVARERGRPSRRTGDGLRITPWSRVGPSLRAAVSGTGREGDGVERWRPHVVMVASAPRARVCWAPRLDNRRVLMVAPYWLENELVPRRQTAPLGGQRLQLLRERLS